MKRAKGLVQYCDCNCTQCMIDGTDIEYICPYCDAKCASFGVIDDIHQKVYKIACEDCDKKFWCDIDVEYM